MPLVSELVTELKIKDSGFASGMKLAAGAVASLTASSVALFAAVDSVTSKIDAMTKSADRLGIVRQNFEALSYAASIANVSTDAMEKGMKKLASVLDEANNGGDQAANTLTRLGLSAKELQGLSLDKQYQTVAEALNQVADKSEQVALAQKLFGRAGIENLSLVHEGVGNLISEYERMGITISDRQAQMADAFQDSKDRLSTVFTGFAGQVASEVAPAFTVLMDGLRETLVGTDGVRDAAKSMSQVIVDGLILGTKGLDVFLTGLDQVIDGFSRLAVARQWAINIASGAGASVDPNMIGTAGSSKLGGSLSDVISNLEKTRTNIGQDPMQSFIPSIVKASDAVSKFAEASTKASSQISSMIKGEEDAAIRGEINRLVGSTKDTRPIAQSAQFDYMFKDLYKGIQEGHTGDLSAKFSALEAQVQNMRGGSAMTGKDYYNIAPLVGAINDLKNFAADKTGQKDKMKLDISVSATSDFNVKIAKSKEVEASINQKARDLMSQEAAGRK